MIKRLILAIRDFVTIFWYCSPKEAVTNAKGFWTYVLIGK